MQFKRLEQLLSADYPLPLSHNARAIIAAIDDVRRHDVPLFAQITPFASTDAMASINYLSWTGPQRQMDEIVLVSQRVPADDGCPLSEERDGAWLV
jgi:hypothetical protein